MERPQALGPVEVGCVKDAVVIIPIEGFGLKHNLSEKVPSEIGETILDVRFIKRGFGEETEHRPRLLGLVIEGDDASRFFQTLGESLLLTSHG
jgi:hypothetical protein